MSKVPLLGMSLLGITSAHAEPSGFLFKGFTGESAFDRTWSMFNLYKDDHNPVLQEFKLQGRLQVQSIYGESDGDSFNTSDFKDAGNDKSVWGNEIEARRAKIGFTSTWFQNWEFDGIFDVDADGMDDTGASTLYEALYELNVTYAPSAGFNISVGKSKVNFTREQEIPSFKILTMERSLLSNTLFPGELTGIRINGKGIKGGWLYEFGIYGNDRQREFSDGDGGTIVLSKIGYDYADELGLDTAVASLHYMTNSEPNYKPTNTPEYTTGTSPNFKSSFAIINEISQGSFGLMSEVVLAHGDGAQSDIMGLILIPSYFISDNFQLVTRFQIATSEDPNGLRLPSRYERLVIGDDESGNTYTSVYLGFNYYIYGHKLKLINGIEYSHLGGGDYNGVSYMTGLRFAF